MAEHKIPQDVEAEDKILGPFSFRQFIYLLISVMAGGGMFILGKIALPLAFIPLPIFVFFGALALPLKKDQPMEAYLGAMFRFLLLPKTRVWTQDTYENLVEITAPVMEDGPKTKDVVGEELSQRLSFLSELEDTQGWSVLGVNAPVSGNFNEELINNQPKVTDIMDENSENSRAIEKNLEVAQSEIKKEFQQKIITDNTSLQPTNSPAQNNQINNSPAPSTQLPLNSPNIQPVNASLEDETAAEELLKKSALSRPEPMQNMRQHVIQPISQNLPSQNQTAAQNIQPAPPSQNISPIENIPANQTQNINQNIPAQPTSSLPTSSENLSQTVENSGNLQTDNNESANNFLNSENNLENSVANEQNLPNQSENVKISETEVESNLEGETDIKLH